MFALLGLVLITHAMSLIEVSKDKSRMCKILAGFLLDNHSMLYEPDSWLGPSLNPFQLNSMSSSFEKHPLAASPQI